MPVGLIALSALAGLAAVGIIFGWLMFSATLFGSSQMARDPQHLALFAGVTALALLLVGTIPLAWRLQARGAMLWAHAALIPMAVLGGLGILWFGGVPFLDRWLDALIPA